MNSVATLVELPSKPRTCLNLIHNEWRAARSGKTLEVRSPYTGGVIGSVTLSESNDVADAVESASRAFPAWRETPIKERTQILLKFRELVLQNLEGLAHTAAAEAGKMVDEARAGILKGIEVTEFAASLQNLDQGGAMEVSRGVTCQFRREPVGVVCGITPFNFPAMVPFWMYPIALTVGNCFILKPSEKVPLTSSLIGELIVQAGFPPGVFSIVNGTKSTVEALIDNPNVRAIGFVGSTPVAKSLYARATALGKRALTLGGAKNNLIIVPDADEALTVRGVVDSFTGCAGQRCMAASLVVAVGEVDKILAQIADQARSIQPGAQIGAIIDRQARERIVAAIQEAEKAGATIVVDGRKAAPPKGYEGGNWLGPTIIDHATAEMACAREEIFGPVLTIVRVKSLADAMQLEAQNRFGNATSVFTTSGAVSRYVADHATAGMVGINIGIPVPREPFSFGGRKDSKFGHGDITGESAVDFWSDLKKITTKWQLQRDHTWMS